MTDTPNTTLLMRKPSNAFAPLKAYANAEIAVRAGAGNIYPKVDTLHKGKPITLWEPKEVANDGSIWIYFEYSKDGLPTGAWINSASLNITFHPPTVEVKKVDTTSTSEVPAIKPDEPPTVAPDSLQPITNADGKNAQNETSRDLEPSQIAMLQQWRGELQFKLNHHKAEMEMCIQRLAFVDQALSTVKV